MDVFLLVWILVLSNVIAILAFSVIVIVTLPGTNSWLDAGEEKVGVGL